MYKALYVRFYKMMYGDNLCMSAVLKTGYKNTLIEVYTADFASGIVQVLARVDLKIDNNFPIYVESEDVYKDLSIDRVTKALKSNTKIIGARQLYISKSTAGNLSVHLASKSDFEYFESITNGTIMGKNVTSYSESLIEVG